MTIQEERRGTKGRLTLRAFGVFAAVALLLAAGAAQATIYLNLDAEEGTVAEAVPFPPFCQACGGGGPWPLGTYESEGGAAQGSKYYRWQTQDNQLETYTEVLLPGYRPFARITNILGNTYYLAAYVRYDRIAGRDIWHECTSCDSFDKLIYLWGTDVRWGIVFGQRAANAVNQDHRYSVYVIDCSACNLAPNVKLVDDTYPQNQSGFSPTNPIQLDYERWYAVVFAVRMATDNTGWFTLYVDGVKVSEWTDRQTVAVGGAPDIEQIILGGTIAQPAYDSPAHQVKVDALLLTDNWQDIVNGGYLAPPGGGDTLAPAAPTNLTVQ